jgi:membrane fusion protein, multidrug efflux system
MKDLKGFMRMITALVIFLACFGCQKKEAISVKDAPSEAIPVKVVTVKSETMQEFIDYVANIKAQEETQVFPRVTGKIIEKVKQEGDPVTKGETIALVDRDETGLKFAQAAVESPIAGVVGKVLVDVGANVSPQTPVALVVDMEKVKIFLDVPEKYLPSISFGMSATVGVEAYPDEIFTGTIVRISPLVDIATRTCQVEIAIDNEEHKLRSGMYAKVKVVTREYKDAIALLKEAVLGREPQQYVYVVKEQKAQLREVKTGVRQGPYLQILEGLQQGDKVVIMGQQRLREGAAVLVEDNGV